MHNQISLTSLFIHIFLNIMIFNKIRNYIWFNYCDIVHSILDPFVNVVKHATTFYLGKKCLFTENLTLTEICGLHNILLN